MPSPAEDRKYIEKGIDALENYLLSDVIYYPMIAPMPSLTLGGLMLAQRRLNAYEDASPLDMRLDTLRTRWRATWEKKAAQELRTRLKLWENYLNEYRYNEDLAEYYAHEVRLRVMLGLLTDELKEEPDELFVLDQLLRANFIPGEFIWDEVLSVEFSRDDFWFLYGSLE
jgi:hypothetical protein